MAQLAPGKSAATVNGGKSRIIGTIGIIVKGGITVINLTTGESGKVGRIGTTGTFGIPFDSVDFVGYAYAFLFPTIGQNKFSEFV